jgi:hypothetical protein
MRLPDPSGVLDLPLEHRTVNTLRRAAAMSSAGNWTVQRYLELPRFGGRALVDLLAAVEANHEPVPLGTASVDDQGEHDAGSWSPAGVDRLLRNIAGGLPTTEAQLNARLIREGAIASPLDVEDLLRSAAALGRPVPLRVIVLRGSRVVVRLSELTVARTAYRIASRAMHDWGADTVQAVTTKVRLATDATIGGTFVEQLLTGLTAFRWLQRRTGWFWFVHPTNPLLVNLRKILCVATRVPVTRLMLALFRDRSHPSIEALQAICASVPGARVEGGLLAIDRPLERAAHLNPSEARIVSLLEAAGGSLPASQIRQLVRGIGLPWTSVRRMLHCSPVFEQAHLGSFQLVGTRCRA